ncbi:hypothetical protein B0H16DRAFT_1693113 [Mycena metata]|uniref:Uncharacterized protein n=1 Tax=Mycena metata TaxID=1033252 RepID=A0AAD7IKI3_9AGAR|nr:hypothetical protein B0H16DRAFT_1706612 [Mycena metata]KAJ7744920.1 hypothetical protein B0H16DRAFT_1693113 [Mycena metata]
MSPDASLAILQPTALPHVPTCGVYSLYVHRALRNCVGTAAHGALKPAPRVDVIPSSSDSALVLRLSSDPYGVCFDLHQRDREFRQTWNVPKTGFQLEQILPRGLVNKGVLCTQKRNVLLFVGVLVLRARALNWSRARIFVLKGDARMICYEDAGPRVEDDGAWTRHGVRREEARGSGRGVGRATVREGSTTWAAAGRCMRVDERGEQRTTRTRVPRAARDCVQGADTEGFLDAGYGCRGGRQPTFCCACSGRPGPATACSAVRVVAGGGVSDTRAPRAGEMGRTQMWWSCITLCTSGWNTWKLQLELLVLGRGCAGGGCCCGAGDAADAAVEMSGFEGVTGGERARKSFCVSTVRAEGGWCMNFADHARSCTWGQEGTMMCALTSNLSQRGRVRERRAQCVVFVVSLWSRAMAADAEEAQDAECLGAVVPRSHNRRVGAQSSFGLFLDPLRMRTFLSFPQADTYAQAGVVHRVVALLTSKTSAVHFSLPASRLWGRAVISPAAH